VPNRCDLCKEFALRALDERIGALMKAAGPASEYDIDGIHDVRVASRRIRSLLRAHKMAFKKKPFEGLRGRVRAVTRGLGDARELDVTIGLLEKRRKQLKGPARLAANQTLRLLRQERTEELSSVDASVHLVRDARFAECLDTLKASAKGTKRCYLDIAAKALDKRLEALEKCHAKWRQTYSEEDLHQVRIAFKRLRYSCEIFRPLYPEALQDFLDTLKKTQEHLGDWNDVRILRDRTERLAKSISGDAAEGISMLQSQFDRQADELREAYELDSEAFFSGDALSETRALLGAPTHACCSPGMRKGS
jgi:CHAD domain-containing protein